MLESKSNALPTWRYPNDEYERSLLICKSEPSGKEKMRRPGGRHKRVFFKQGSFIDKNE